MLTIGAGDTTEPCPSSQGRQVPPPAPAAVDDGLSDDDRHPALCTEENPMTLNESTLGTRYKEAHLHVLLLANDIAIFNPIDIPDDDSSHGGRKRYGCGQRAIRVANAATTSTVTLPFSHGKRQLNTLSHEL